MGDSHVGSMTTHPLCNSRCRGVYKDFPLNSALSLSLANHPLPGVRIRVSFQRWRPACYADPATTTSLEPNCNEQQARQPTYQGRTAR